MIYCKKCGQQIEENVICPKCGCLSGYTEPKTKKEIKNISKIYAVSIIAIVLIIIDKISYYRYGFYFDMLDMLLIVDALLYIVGFAELCFNKNRKKKIMIVIYPIALIINTLISLYFNYSHCVYIQRDYANYDGYDSFVHFEIFFNVLSQVIGLAYIIIFITAMFKKNKNLIKLSIVISMAAYLTSIIYVIFTKFVNTYFEIFANVLGLPDFMNCGRISTIDFLFALGFFFKLKCCEENKISTVNDEKSVV